MQFPAVLRVRTTDGRELVEEVLVNRGGPGDPLSLEELTAKFRDNAGRLLPALAIDKLTRDVARLDHTTDLSAVLAPLRAVDDLRRIHGDL